MPKRKSEHCNPDLFCYVCGAFVILSNRININARTSEAYLEYFGFPIANQEKNWVPHVTCKNCNRIFSERRRDPNRKFDFAIPMIWKEPNPTNHELDCYFCQTDTVGHNSKTLKNIIYPTNTSSTRPKQRAGREELAHEESSDQSSSNTAAADPEYEHDESGPLLVNQDRLNNLIRDLDLPEDKALLLSSRLREWRLLTSDTI
ncbi:hypothetical protein DMENIID0001_001100 [Sergentomyia squamirostris]